MFSFVHFYFFPCAKLEPSPRLLAFHLIAQIRTLPGQTVSFSRLVSTPGSTNICSDPRSPTAAGSLRWKPLPFVTLPASAPSISLSFSDVLSPVVRGGRSTCEVQEETLAFYPWNITDGFAGVSHLEMVHVVLDFVQRHFQRLTPDNGTLRTQRNVGEPRQMR